MTAFRDSCESRALSNWTWQRVDADSLRWAKERKPILGAVPVGTTVRAEIVAPPIQPVGFRVWRTRALLSALFTRFRKARPLVLQVGGWDNDVVHSEDFNTGSLVGWKQERYEFDPNVERPRSGELVVVPHTKIERSRGAVVVSSSEIALSSDFVPAKAGTKLDLRADRSTHWTYDVTAARDPDLEAQVLVPWSDEADLTEHIVQLLSADAAETYAADPEQFRGGAYAFVRALVPMEGAPAGHFELEQTMFSLAEGERQLLTVSIHAERAGTGLFAIRVVDADGVASTTDPWLYVVSEERDSVDLYDAVVKDYAEEEEEDVGLVGTPVSPTDLSGRSLPIPYEAIDVEVVLAEP